LRSWPPPLPPQQRCCRWRLPIFRTVQCQPRRRRQQPRGPRLRQPALPLSRLRHGPRGSGALEGLAGRDRGGPARGRRRPRSGTRRRGPGRGPRRRRPRRVRAWDAHFGPHRVVARRRCAPRCGPGTRRPGPGRGPGHGPRRRSRRCRSCGARRGPGRGPRWRRPRRVRDCDAHFGPRRCCLGKVAAASPNAATSQRQGATLGPSFSLPTQIKASQRYCAEVQAVTPH